jgi:hypothetical protein
MTPHHKAQAAGIAVTALWLAIWALIARRHRNHQRRVANSLRESARQQLSRQRQREKSPDEAA